MALVKVEADVKPPGICKCKHWGIFSSTWLWPLCNRQKRKYQKLKDNLGWGIEGCWGGLPPSKAEGGWWGHGTGGGTTEPHRPPLHPSPKCESSRCLGYLAQHQQHPALVYVAFSETHVSLSSTVYKPPFQHPCCAGASWAVHIRGQSPLGS